LRLHSPQFERTLRQRIRKTVRSSAELKKELRSNRIQRRSNFTGLVRLGISLGLGLTVFSITPKTDHAAAALAAINLWAFFLAFGHAHRLATCLYAAADLPALSLLPIPGKAIFQWEMQKFWWGSIWSLIDFFAAYTALLFGLELWTLVPWGTMFPVVFATWLMPLALAFLGVAYLPRFPYQLFYLCGFLIVIILFVARTWIGPLVLDFLDQSAPALNLLLPTGWPVSLFQVPLQQQWLFLGLLVPIAGVIWTLKRSIAKLPSEYQFAEPAFPESADLVPAEAAEDKATVEDTPPDQPRQLGLTAIEEIVQSRRFLIAPSWHKSGWCEGALWRWFTERERALSEFVFPNGCALGAAWKKIFRNLMVALFTGLAVGVASPSVREWVLAAGLFVTGCQALAAILGSGSAFRPMSYSGVQMPFYAGFPIGFRELSGLLIKCSFVQLPLVVAFSVVSSACMAWLTKFPLTPLLLIGFKSGFLLLAGRLMLLPFSFSSGTNDNAGFSIRVVALLLLFLGGGGLFLGLAGAGLFVPNHLVAWALWFLAIVQAWLFLQVYGWFYKTSRFDLMSIPRS